MIRPRFVLLLTKEWLHTTQPSQILIYQLAHKRWTLKYSAIDQTCRNGGAHAWLYLVASRQWLDSYAVKFPDSVQLRKLRIFNHVDCQNAVEKHDWTSVQLDNFYRIELGLIRLYVFGISAHCQCDLILLLLYWSNVITEQRPHQ